MQTVTIIRQHDKLSILEGLLNNDSELEKIVSGYIDECERNNNKNITIKYTTILKHKINNYKLICKIIKLATSIAYDKPFIMKIPLTNTTDDVKLKNIIQYLNQPFVPFIPNYSLPAFS